MNNNSNVSENSCKNAGTCPLALSFAIAEILAESKTNPELAVISSFLSSLAANLGVIIQNRNLCEINQVETPAEQDIFELINNPTTALPPTQRRS